MFQHERAGAATPEGMAMLTRDEIHLRLLGNLLVPLLPIAPVVVTVVEKAMPADMAARHQAGASGLSFVVMRGYVGSDLAKYNEITGHAP